MKVSEVTSRFSIFLLLTCGALCLHAQAGSFNGNWVTVTHQMEDGTDFKVYYQLKQSGSEITGRAIYPWGILTIAGGKANGQDFGFTQHMWEGLDFEVKGQLVGQELHYQATSWDHKWHDYVAHAVPLDEGNPPPPLPLPELRQIPDNGLSRTPPMGWNSWNKFGSKISDAVVREMADRMASNGMRDAGYVFLNIDDGWEGARDSAGVIHSNAKFPDMKNLADYVHGKGLKFGIYTSPGPKTCSGLEGSFGHEQEDAKTFASWGIDYVKYDSCSVYKIYNESQSRAIYQKMGEALLSTGRPIVYSLCGPEDSYLYGRAVGGDLWRVSGDISDNWDSMSRNGFGQDKIASYAGPGHWNDPDMLEVGNGGMTADEYRTHMSLWAILAAPLIAGNDLRSMSDETKSILLNREVIAIDQDSVGQEGAPISRANGIEIWTRPLSGKAFAVGIFNRTEAPADVTFRLDQLRQPVSGKVRDLLAHAAVAIKDGSLKASIPRHGVVLLRIE
jgi:alpha-galactosidase